MYFQFLFSLIKRCPKALLTPGKYFGFKLSLTLNIPLYTFLLIYMLISLPRDSSLPPPGKRKQSFLMVCLTYLLSLHHTTISFPSQQTGGGRQKPCLSCSLLLGTHLKHSRYSVNIYYWMNHWNKIWNSIISIKWGNYRYFFISVILYWSAKYNVRRG